MRPRVFPAEDLGCAFEPEVEVDASMRRGYSPRKT